MREIVLRYGISAERKALQDGVTRASGAQVALHQLDPIEHHLAQRLGGRLSDGTSQLLPARRTPHSTQRQMRGERPRLPRKSERLECCLNPRLKRRQRLRPVGESDPDDPGLAGPGKGAKTLKDEVNRTTPGGRSRNRLSDGANTTLPNLPQEFERQVEVFRSYPSNVGSSGFKPVLHPGQGYFEARIQIGGDKATDC